MLRKRENGADGFVTQPALLTDGFGMWRRAIERAGALDGDDVGVFMGLTTITSVRNLEFWYSLTGIDVSKSLEADAMLRAYRSARASMDDETFDAWTFERAQLSVVHAASVLPLGKRTISVAKTPAAAAAPFGLHFMPVHEKGYDYVRRLLDDPIFTTLKTSP
jgi:hypothetical protein